ncbi:MAG: tripartite tricarboxylate transporter substrate binding protein [Alphaproteobacteria bacterium]|nr:tripartite tricarboxylate transporter substrate binding protein [Alphaproteobacteria bacterium]
MSLSRRAALAALASAPAAALLGGVPALAQGAGNYPSRPVKIVVPFAPGGGADNLARLVAPLLREKLGQEFVIENRGGGGSSLGTVFTINAGGDGYTLVVHSSSAAINLALYGQLPYDLYNDLKPVSLMASGPVVLVAHPSTGVRTMEQLLERGRAQPGRVNFATGGNGSPPHLALELMMHVTGVRFVPVHYRGAGPATTDVLGGHVGYMYSGVSQSRAHIEAGRLVAIGVTGTSRLPALPNTPTMAELGYPRVSDAGTYWGMLAPKGTPDEIVNRLSATMAEVMKNAGLVERMTALGYVGIGSTPAEYAAHIRGEVERWTAVARASDIKPD